MRPFKPAPKNASANRIRERYLHQLGLQRGAAPLSAPHHPSNNHVVVISGLPSLPEDRATTEHIMESHDFSVSKNSQPTVSAAGGSVDANSCNGDNDDMSDSGSVQGQIHTKVIPEDAHSQCSNLSVSPNTVAGGPLTAMALHYPTSLRKIPHPNSKPLPPPPGNNNSMPFSLSHSMPWNCNLSKSATVLLDLTDHQRGGNDNDSVSSAGTTTTAESSLTATHATMMSRDWGAVPHPSSAGVSVSSMGGESPASTPGVYFQCGHPRLLGGHVHVGPSSGCASTSSLAHALNRFNIDSDCEASVAGSVASNSLMEDHIMDENDDCSLDDTASRCSVASHASAGSTKSQLSSASHSIRNQARKKKIGKTQRLMNRAVAHERILQIRSDHSQKMRANLVHTQRMSSSNHQVSVSGLSTAMAQEVQPLSVSPGSTSSSQASMPLMHVQHGSGDSSVVPACSMHNGVGGSVPLPQQSTLPQQSMGDLGRTPTSSNCSDLQRQLKALGSPSQYCMPMPAGVHQQLQGSNHAVRNGVPLGFHPQLASRIPAPPPKLGAGMMMMMPPPPIVKRRANSMSQPIVVPQVEDSTMDTTTEDCSTPSSLQYMNHTKQDYMHEAQQATVDDVMEVATFLSKLGGTRTTGSIPRIR